MIGGGRQHVPAATRFLLYPAVPIPTSGDGFRVKPGMRGWGVWCVGLMFAHASPSCRPSRARPSVFPSRCPVGDTSADAAHRRMSEREYRFTTDRRPRPGTARGAPLRSRTARNGLTRGECSEARTLSVTGHGARLRGGACGGSYHRTRITPPQLTGRDAAWKLLRCFRRKGPKRDGSAPGLPIREQSTLSCQGEEKTECRRLKELGCVSPNPTQRGLKRPPHRGRIPPDRAMGSPPDQVRGRLSSRREGKIYKPFSNSGRLDRPAHGPISARRGWSRVSRFYRKVPFPETR